MTQFLIATFYRFTTIEDLPRMQGSIENCCRENDVKGIVLLANEGINATIAGTPDGVLAVLSFLRKDSRLAELAWKESSAKEQPFRKLRVRLKKEIVTMGVPGIDPERLTGTYVKPEDWNEFVSDPNVMVLDTRNDYEVEIGSFKDAINPNITSFGELPQWIENNIDVDAKPRIAMYCTGGIRCEKASAVMLKAGFEDVRQLEGGILGYFEECGGSHWSGDCFVFDQRVALDHQLEESEIVMCFKCREPLSIEEQQSKHYAIGEHCPYCFESGR